MQYETLILGAGPAGLQLAYYLQKKQRPYLILESGDSPGSFFKKFPRHRRLISINKVVTGFDDAEMNLRWDWNSLLNDELKFTDYSRKYFPDAEDYCQYLLDFANRHDLKIQYGFQVSRVRKDKDCFILKDTRGHEVKSKVLIVATGLSKPQIPTFPGVELAELYGDVSIDPRDFEGQRVLVVGKGNSALETADNLIETTASIHICSPTPARMAWTTHFVGNIRAINNNFLDTYQLKSQNVVLDAWVESLEKTPSGGIMCHILYSHAKGEKRSIPFDRAILATGFRFDDSIFDDSCKPELAFDKKLPAMTSSWESTNVENMYFAGALMQMRDFKKTMSGFIHGFRHNVKMLVQIVEHKHHGKPIRGEGMTDSPRALADRIVDRLTRSASMYLQPGFFCDMLVVHNKNGVEYYDDIPIDYIADSEFCRNRHYYTISLEYGDYSQVRDPFAIDRDPDPSNAHLIEYLHPIIRRYGNGNFIRAHHLVEDLENDYVKERYIASISDFLERELAMVSV